MYILHLVSAIAVILTFVGALPSDAIYATRSDSPPTAKPGEFFLVTADQPERASNASQLRGVSATTPFQQDPVSATLVLRLLPPGYNILPAFSLTNTKTLSVRLSTGRGSYTYYSAPVLARQELEFFAEQPTPGEITLIDGYLVSLAGKSDGWAICKTERGSQLLFWMGEGEACRKTWLHAVIGAPYRKL